MRTFFVLVLGALAACSPATEGDVTGLHPDASGVDACVGCDAGPRDAHVDAPVDATVDAPSDAGDDGAAADAADLGTPDAGVCGDGGMCCNRVTDCPVVGGVEQVCVHHACAAPTSCTSSTTCPGLVCATMLATGGICADCNDDGDCTSMPGTRCGANVCTPAPGCSSDTQCTAMGLVCDVSHGRCVECNTTTDCPSSRFCSADHVCLPTCRTDADCVDTLYCNGTETCDPSAVTHDVHGCVAGTSPCSPPTPTCTESSHSCTT